MTFSMIFQHSLEEELTACDCAIRKTSVWHFFKYTDWSNYVYVYKSII
jgi:hypothetical protein